MGLSPLRSPSGDETRAVINGACVWKYVDDTTASEVVGKGEISSAQIIADKVAEWSLANRVQLNNEKCKELRISFARNKAIFEPIRVHGKELELVDNAKLLGITITSDLSWNTHVNDVTKKAAKRLYLLVQLKRAKVPCNDLGLFYITCVRSVLDYAIPVYYYSLPKYLVNELERVQKRALKIMYPSLSYDEALTHMKIAPLSVHHSDICATPFNEILSDSDHRLRALLLPSHQACKYSPRRTRKFDIRKINTKRARNSFIIKSSFNTYTV